jgi:hypothetical protein
MREHLSIYVPVFVGMILSIMLWVMLSRKLARVGKSRWRAVVFCLPLFLAISGYGLFWFGFFSSQELAVKLHAVRLTIVYFTESFLPVLGVLWLMISAWLITPVLRKVAV